MFTRHAASFLHEWKTQPDRKPLIIRGARQVGKTTIVDLFSKEFDNYIYLNLELGRDRNIFDGDLSAREVFQAMQLIKNVQAHRGETLIFIDEIQHSHAAVSMLRYFYEETSELFIIAAGSLLEIMIEKSEISFPVGRVEYLYMYPFSFSEYLEAKHEIPTLKAYDEIPVKKFAVSKLMRLFHEYALIGGMPEIVKKYVETGDLASLNRNFEALIISYINDSDKYARNNTLRQVLRHAIEAIPFEAGNRIKFHGFGKSNYKSREMGEALRTIQRAMLAYLIYPSTSAKIPIRPDFKKAPKLQFVDTGMLNYFVGLQPDYYRFDNLHGFYQGLIAEHVVRQELMAIDLLSNHISPFWVREKKQANAEVDVLLQYKGMVIPVEIKAGKAGALRSLHEFMDKTDHSVAIRLYAGALEITDSVTKNGKSYKLLNLPYFLAGKIFDYLEYHSMIGTF
jgi:uncharacterized protein